MTNYELQMELISRGLTSSGSREGMLKTLFSGDKSKVLLVLSQYLKPHLCLLTKDIGSR